MSDPPIVLDWTGRKHMGSRRAKCRHCTGLTWLRDDDGKPCHKTCAEQDLARALARQAGQAGNYRTRTRTEGNGDDGHRDEAR